MLVVLSDLHLTDESTCINVHESAFTQILLPDILANAKAKGAKEVRLVLLGDIFDLVRTDFWLDKVPSNERPWNGSLSPDTGMNTKGTTEGHYNAVLEEILKRKSSVALFKLINGIKKNVRVHTKITYVVGNHDRALNVFSSLQDQITSKIKNVDDIEFLNVLYAPEYGLLGRHGHEWDKHNHGYEFYRDVLKKGANVQRFDKKCYKVQTIGEVVTAELMSGLIFRLKQQVRDADSGLLTRLMDINNIRPMTDAFIWLEWFGRGNLGSNEKEILLRCLNQSIRAVLDTDLAKKWDDLVSELFIFKGDLTDRLEQLWRFMRDKSFDDLKRNVDMYTFFDGVFGSSKDDYVEGAKQEWKSGLAKDVQYVLYGHTHEARHDYFSGNVDGSVNMYVNTGTYLPLIQRAINGGFSSAHQMTTVFCYRGDEDTDSKEGETPSMEVWNGIKRKTYQRIKN